MDIADNILKYYLRNVYFITGTAYAGKSTACKRLAEKYDMILCGENYHFEVTQRVAQPDIQPDLCYMRQMKSWQDFVKRCPEEYERWIFGTGRELAGFEVAHLIGLSQEKRVMVDTNLPLDVLHRIADYNHAAVMLTPQSMSVERFFDRNDPEKRFILETIMQCDEPEKVLANYREGLKRINSREHYNEMLNSGFFVIEREDVTKEDPEDVCRRLAEHFRL